MHMTTTDCPGCGGSLTVHIGGKPCTGATQETYGERRARAVREQERKRVVRLFGEDAI